MINSNAGGRNCSASQGCEEADKTFRQEDGCQITIGPETLRIQARLMMM